jgi:hypothetical protein
MIDPFVRIVTKKSSKVRPLLLFSICLCVGLTLAVGPTDQMSSLRLRVESRE